MEKQPPKVPPPWFRCLGCGRNREGHDAAERRVPPHARHEFVSVTKAMNTRNRERAQRPLIED